MNKKIAEGNRLIAEFMGAIVTLDYCEIPDVQDGLGFYFKKENAPDFDLRYCSEGLKYHSSWDWLMPVVEKIESLGYQSETMGWHLTNGLVTTISFWVNRTDYSKEPERVCCKESKKKIEAVWTAVIEFIKYKNSNTIIL